MHYSCFKVFGKEVCQPFPGIPGRVGKWFYGALLLGMALGGCRDADLPLEAEEGEELSGGAATVFDQSPNAFGLQVPGLVGLQELEFFVGNSFFNQNWVSAPASTTARDGLGPLFNARSCSGCHFKDGRGRPPSFTGELSTGFLVRLAVQGGTSPEPIYGGQLQDQAILGVPVEGTVSIVYEEQPGQYPDGEGYSLRKPHYQFTALGYGNLASDLLFSPRVANQMAGLGLLEALDEGDLLALADPADRDGDGISGRPNYVWDAAQGAMRLGRFGWKASQPNLRQQTAGAFLGDMGITSTLFPDENCSAAQLDCQAAPNGGNPEITDDDLRKVVLYVQSLAVPARRNWADQEVLLGKQRFEEIGCVACHVPKFTTGTGGDLPALSGQVIRPYTDLLLHDMGDGLADGRPDHEATGKEWRTPPLWGVGLIEVVNQHTYYLHDGRARNLEEAILWHQGEAQQANERFQRLPKADRQAVLAFLRSL